MKKNPPPLIAEFSRIIRENGNATEAAECAGVARSAMWRWLRCESQPRVLLFDAVLRACGYQLVIVPIRGKPMIEELFDAIDRDFASGVPISKKTMHKLAEARANP